MRIPEEIFQYYKERIKESCNKNRGKLIDPFGTVLWEEQEYWESEVYECMITDNQTKRLEVF